MKYFFVFFRMKIYTKTGDAGKTCLRGMECVDKDNPRVLAYGQVDELNASIGMVIAHIQDTKINSILLTVQYGLFTVGTCLASADTSPKKITKRDILFLERSIDFYDEKLPTLKNFIIPGGKKGGAFLHFARTVCRRAERDTVALSKKEYIDPNILVYVNRLSDLLFVLARYVNWKAGEEENIVK